MMSIVVVLGRWSRGYSEPALTHDHGSSSTRPTGWLTALEVHSDEVIQANQPGQSRRSGVDSE
jgi:hypothetical protein